MTVTITILAGDRLVLRGVVVVVSMGTSMGVSVRTVIIVVVSLRVVISFCERHIWDRSPTVSVGVVLLIIVGIIVTVISKTPIANLIVVIVLMILRFVVVIEPLRVGVETPVTNVGVGLLFFMVINNWLMVVMMIRVRRSCWRSWIWVREIIDSDVGI